MYLKRNAELQVTGQTCRVNSPSTFRAQRYEHIILLSLKLLDNLYKEVGYIYNTDFPPKQNLDFFLGLIPPFVG